jgi:hypothetical protein
VNQFKQDNIEKLRTVEDVSEAILNIKPARTYDLIRRGILKPPVVVRLGERQIRINEARLREWLEKGGASCTEEENG